MFDPQAVVLKIQLLESTLAMMNQADWLAQISGKTLTKTRLEICNRCLDLLGDIDKLGFADPLLGEAKSVLEKSVRLLKFKEMLETGVLRNVNVEEALDDLEAQLARLPRLDKPAA